MALTINQGYSFFIFLIIGITIGIVFDIFRIIRKSYAIKSTTIQIQDLLFWIISGIIIAYGVFAINYGEIRAYFFLGIILGITIYILTVSKFIQKVGIKVLETLTKISKRIIGIILIPIKSLQKMIIKPSMFICINISKSIKNTYININKNIKNKMSNTYKKPKKGKKKKAKIKK